MNENESAEDAETSTETAKEWGDRQARETKRFRFGCGAVIGLFVGLYVLGRIAGFGHWYVAVPIILGCVLLCAKYFSEEDDGEVANAIGWIVWPEWKILEQMPLWMMFVIFGLLIVVFILLWSVFMVGMIH